MTDPVCPFCVDPNRPPPPARLIETDRFFCPGCRREFAAFPNPHAWSAALVAERPTLLIGDLLRGVPGTVHGEPSDAQQPELEPFNGRKP